MDRDLRAITNPLNRILRKIPGAWRYPITRYPDSYTVRGRVLFSYLDDPLLWAEKDPRFDGHSNNWRSREIVRIFNGLGYVVDAINWSNNKFMPSLRYDVVLDIFTNLQRIAPYLDQDTIKILHCTGSDPYYQNRAEMERVESLERRRGILYSPKRQVPYPELALKSLRVSDACALVGNDHTVATYPQEQRDRIETVPVVASNIGRCGKSHANFVPAKREFLWFFGSGAVHKGLDRVIEAFSGNSSFTLNIVGKLESEPDFLKVYERELTQLENIKYHGYLKPNSDRFAEVVKDSFCFIAPSCSEGTSAAAATCLQIGLYPIVSRDTGVSLPTGCGKYLEECSIEEIRDTVVAAHSADKLDLATQISSTQKFAVERYSRERFRQEMESFIVRTLREHDRLQLAGSC